MSISNSLFTLSDFTVHRIIGQLETLKKEAAEVQRKVDETDVVMGEVERVSQQYMPLSSACSLLYFTLESLHLVGGCGGRVQAALCSPACVDVDSVSTCSSDHH